MKKKVCVAVITISFLLVSISSVFVLVNKNNNENYKLHYYRLNDLYSKANLKTINFEQETLNSINKEKDNLKLAEYYDALTRYYILNNNLEKAKTYSDKTIREYSKLKNKDNYILDAFKNISILDIWQNNGSESLNYYDRMLEVSKKNEIIKSSGFTKEDVEGLNNAMLTAFYSKCNNYNKANEYFKFLNDFDSKNIKDKEISYIITYAKSMYNFNFGDIKMSEQDMEKLCEKMDGESRNLVYIKSDIYLSTAIIKISNGNLENALGYIDKAIKINNNEKKDLLIECYIAYGFYYDMSGVFDNAKINYEKALSLAEENKDNTKAIRSLGSLIALYEKNNRTMDKEGDYKKFWKLSIANQGNAESYIKGILALNNQLGNERISVIEKEKKSEIEKRKAVNLVLVFAVVTLVLLGLTTYKLYYEIKLRKNSESKLKKIINEDYLTKAYTRGYAYENLKSILKSKKSIHLAMVDLDNYKRINDKFGHDVGDRVLISFVEICKSFLSGEDFVARFGGEEFIIILDDKTKEEAIQIVEGIREKLENKEWNKEDLKVTASIGLVHNEYEDVDTLIKKADDLLYIAKRTGKNKVQLE
ncbi:diguanylate cyclase (GGDEF) domain-containing protein [Clostridium cavendishii DSM 21758]|uniref:Diguanylate cyclase (GGDEF) domain-containing protein n=1 Tax=Clostridium cavendishii DSM 21758 TaxID=1121302 RepID=A0A1M6TWZ9_9CLOT|nr:GGDEF domain-containing protein [Clostridium cavendishii]SHK61532.1 diguanylate cyclase (GGDEF) domain-containing protein [Clostridium cavendishii DSM 21758]